MNRRDFMKVMGVAAAAPSLPAGNESPPEILKGCTNTTPEYGRKVQAQMNEFLRKFQAGAPICEGDVVLIGEDCKAYPAVLSPPETLMSKSLLSKTRIAAMIQSTLT